MQAFTERDTGNAYDLLLIETPPQHGKSLTVTESFPSWYLGRHPRARVIAASYNDDTARRFGRANQRKLERVGGTLFGLEKGGVWTSTEFEFSNGWGRMISRGIMSGITGNPANLLLIDDPIKNREEADSEVYRARLWEEWQNSLKTRLAAGAKVIVIMTPWHEDDLAARLLRSEQHMQLLRLPVEAEAHDPLGRRRGAPLCPELGKGRRWLAQVKQGYLSDPRSGGARAWRALYQCSPRVEEGGVVLRRWWRYFEPREVDFSPGEDGAGQGTTVISVDAAFKDTAGSDFVSVQVWTKLRGRYYCRYCLNRRLNFPDTVQAVRTVKRLFPESLYILIEDKANGSAVIQTLRSELPGVLGITPRGGKTARVNAVSPAVESGNVLLPQAAAWTAEFVDQFTAFPTGRHDDMVDACSQALGFLLFSHGGFPADDSPDSLRQREALRRERRALAAEQECFLSSEMYSPYFSFF